MAVLIVCFWGVIFPLISELATGQKVTVGPPFYERANAPIFGALMALMAIAPLSAWGKSTLVTLGRAAWKPAVFSVLVAIVIFALGMHNWIALIGFFLVAFVLSVTLYEFWRAARARSRATGENFGLALWNLFGRNRRRYGGYLIHVSMMLMAIGILGIEIFQTETQGTIAQGQSLEVGGYTITYKDLAVFDTNDLRNVARAVMTVEKDGQFVAELYPRRDYFYESQQPMTIPGVRSTLEDDLYIILIDWQPILASGATFKIYHNPLVNWLWIGCVLFILGLLAAAWPDKDPEVEPVRARKTAVVHGAAD
jgi:cytochrome c-type biogenesis protein CcmF